MNHDELAALKRAIGYAIAELRVALDLLDAEVDWPDPRPDPPDEPAEPWARRDR